MTRSSVIAPPLNRRPASRSDVRTQRPRVRRQLGLGPIALRSTEEIAKIRAAGIVLARALERARAACVVGATTASIDAAAHAIIAEAGAEALFLGHPSCDPTVAPFPACCCVSVNDEIVHGIPGSRIVRDGDIVAIDCGVRLDGWCADSAITVGVGRVAPALLELIHCAQSMLTQALHDAGPGVCWSDIAARMERHALERRHGLVVEYVGHGIGRALHETPQVPNCLSREFIEYGDFTLRPGMVIAVEPMITLHGAGVDRDGFALGVATQRAEDGWTVVAADTSPSAHVEHTIAITRRGCDVLTVNG